MTRRRGHGMLLSDDPRREPAVHLDPTISTDVSKVLGRNKLRNSGRVSNRANDETMHWHQADESDQEREGEVRRLLSGLDRPWKNIS